MAFQKNVYQKMLSIAACWLFLTINASFSQTKINWSDSLVVRQTTHSITASRVKMLGDGTMVVVWGESSSPAKIWCSRLENGQFTTPISVVTTTPAPALFGFGGFEVAVHGQKIYVVFERSNSGIFLSRSEDSGLTFLPPVRVQGSVVGSFFTLANVVTDESGNIFVNYILEKGSTATHQIRRSTDGGLTFSPAVEASKPAEGTNVCECCLAAPFAAQGSVWLAFRNNNSNIRDHWVSRSSNLGDSFDFAIDVDDTDWRINVCPISGPRMALTGDSLVVVWKTGAGGGSRVFASILHASTMLLGKQVRLGDAAHFSENQNLPDITAVGDTLGVVLQENHRIAFDFSVGGLTGLTGNYTHFGEPTQDLSYPSVIFRDGSFHLVYVNFNNGEVIYRRGKLTPTVSAEEIVPPVLKISVAPNPATDEIHISLPEIGKSTNWKVVSIEGTTVLAGEFSGVFNMEKINVGHLPSGVYQLNIRTETGILLGKFVKN